MAVAVVRKLAGDLRRGDRPIGPPLALPPAVHVRGGKAVVHYSQIVGIRRGEEEPEVFEPALHLQEGNERGEPVRDERVFPTVVVTVAGYENGRRLDQAPVEVAVRVLEPVDVLDGDVKELGRYGLARR